MRSDADLEFKNLFALAKTAADQLNSRFLNHRELLSKIQNILPSKCTDLDSEDVHKTVDTMEEQWSTDFVGTKEEFVAEFVMWRRHYLNTPKEKKTVQLH